MLRLMFNPVEKNREHLNEIIGEYVEKNPEGLIAKLMPTWKIAESEEKKPAKIIKRLYGKLVSVVKGSDMMQISNKIINGEVHQSVEVFSLAILVFAEVIKNEDVNEQFVMQLIKLVLCSTKRFTIRKLKEPKDIAADNENNKPKKEKNDDDPHRSIMYATESGSISSFVLKSGMLKLILRR
jgi:hypothetical protein